MQSRFSLAMAIAVPCLLAIGTLGLALPASAQAAASAQERRPISELVRDAERAALRVQRLLASVRDTEARERVSCVDGQLSQIHSMLRLTLERQQHLAAAERRGDAQRADRERMLVARLAGDVRRLERQARACVEPEPPLPSGVTQLTVIIEPWVPELDLTVPTTTTR